VKSTVLVNRNFLTVTLLRNFMLIGWFGLKEFPRDVNYWQQVPTACQRRWVLLLLVIRTNITSHLSNTLLLQLFQYILWQNSMPPVLACSPRRLPPIQTMIIGIHETARSCRKFPHHWQRNTGQCSESVWFEVFEIWGQEHRWGRNLCNLNVQTLCSRIKKSGTRFLPNKAIYNESYWPNINVRLLVDEWTCFLRVLGLNEHEPSILEHVTISPRDFAEGERHLP